MTKVRSITDIAALYEAVRAPKQEVVEEKAAKYPKGTFPQANKEVKPSKDFEESGPNKALGSKKKKAKKSPKKNKKHGKVEEDSINSFMKSEFDKLFENVMGDDNSSFDVNPSMGPEGAAGDSPEMDLGTEEEGGDEVTITLSKDLAQQLHDVLMGVLGGEEESDQDLEDLGVDLETEDEPEGGEGDENLNDATEMSELPDATAKMQSKNNKVPGDASKVSSGKADAKVTDECGNKYEGHPMDKESELTKAGHQKVHTSKTTKPGANLFA